MLRMSLSCIMGGLVIWAAPSAMAQSPPPRAPAAACQGKLDVISTGGSQDVAGDVQWMEAYCEPRYREKAVDLIATASVDGALEDLHAAHQEAKQQARRQITEGNAAAGDATAQALTGVILSAPQPVVVVTDVHVIHTRAP